MYECFSEEVHDAARGFRDRCEGIQWRSFIVLRKRKGQDVTEDLFK